MPRKKVTPTEETIPGGGVVESKGNVSKPRKPASRSMSASAQGRHRKASSTTSSIIQAAASESSHPLNGGVSVEEQIALLAYSYWEARGYSGGTPEEDWYRAEEEIRSRLAAVQGK